MQTMHADGDSRVCSVCTGNVVAQHVLSITITVLCQVQVARRKGQCYSSRTACTGSRRCGTMLCAGGMGNV